MLAKMVFYSHMFLAF